MKKAVLGMSALFIGLSAPAIVSAQDPVRNLQDLIGARGGDGEYQMQQRGYTHVRTSKQGDSSFTYWREYRSNRCVAVRTTDGRYQSIVYVPDIDCNNGQSHGEAGWGGSGSGSGSRGVTLYRDINFSGSSETFTRDVADLRSSRIGNDQASSVRVPSGCRARLFQDIDFRGGSTEVTNDFRDLRASSVGNDTVSSIQVRCDGGGWGGGDEWGDSRPSGSHGVTLYRDLNFSGTSETFTRDVADLRSSRIGNDQATAVRVGGGCRARLYQDINFGGAYTEVDYDVADLRGSTVGNDSVSSMRVRCD
jgi:hypothetical protein